MSDIVLMCREAEGHLPMVCMQCGGPATVRKGYTYKRYPSQGYVPLPALLTAAANDYLAQRVKVHFCFCERHKHYWLKRTGLIWAALQAIALLLLAAVSAFTALVPYIRQSVGEAGLEAMLWAGFAAGAVLVVGWLVSIPLSQSWVIRVDQITP